MATVYEDLSAPQKILYQIRQAGKAIVGAFNPVSAAKIESATGKISKETMEKLKAQAIRSAFAAEKNKAKHLNMIDSIINKPKGNTVDNIEDILDECKKLAKETGDCDIIIKLKQPSFDVFDDGKQIDKANRDFYVRFKAEFNNKGKFKGISVYQGNFPNNFKPAYSAKISEEVWKKCKTKDCAYIKGKNDKGKIKREKITFEQISNDNNMKERRLILEHDLRNRINAIYNPQTKEQKKKYELPNAIDRETKKIEAIRDLVNQYYKDYGIPSGPYRIDLQGQPGGKEYEMVFYRGAKNKKTGEYINGPVAICEKGTMEQFSINGENKVKNFLRLSDREKMILLNQFVGLGKHYPAEFRQQVVDAIADAYRGREGKIVRGKEIYSNTVPFSLNGVNYTATKRKDGAYLVERHDGNGHKFKLSTIVDKATGRKFKQGLSFVLDPRNKDDIGFQKIYNSSLGTSCHAYAVVAKEAINTDEVFMNIVKKYGKRDRQGNVTVNIALEKGKSAVTYKYDAKKKEWSAMEGVKKLSKPEQNRLKSAFIASRVVPNDIQVELVNHKKEDVEKGAKAVGIKKDKIKDYILAVPTTIKAAKESLKEKANFIDLKNRKLEAAKEEITKLQDQLRGGKENTEENLSQIIRSFSDIVAQNPDRAIEVSFKYGETDFKIKVDKFSIGKDVTTKNETTINPDGSSKATGEKIVVNKKEIITSHQKATKDVALIGESLEAEEKEKGPEEKSVNGYLKNEQDIRREEIAAVKSDLEEMREQEEKEKAAEIEAFEREFARKAAKEAKRSTRERKPAAAIER